MDTIKKLIAVNVLVALTLINVKAVSRTVAPYYYQAKSKFKEHYSLR